MSHVILKKLAIGLFVLLFCMPLLASVMLSAQSTAEAQQYDVLQVLWMGIYNVPFVVVAVIALVMGLASSKEPKQSATKAALIVSIVASLVGSLFMLAWGLGAL